MLGLKCAFLLGATLATCSGCLSLDVDPEGKAPETLSATQWESRLADSGELLERGCGEPDLHVSVGLTLSLRITYETVRRPAGLTSDPCNTEDDLSRVPQTEVLASDCFADFAQPSPAVLISFATSPADALVEGGFAKASGYVYVFDVLGSGSVNHLYANDCEQARDSQRVANLLAAE